MARLSVGVLRIVCKIMVLTAVPVGKIEECEDRWPGCNENLPFLLTIRLMGMYASRA